MAQKCVCDYCGEDEFSGAEFGLFYNNLHIHIDTIFGEEAILNCNFTMNSREAVEAIAATYKVDNLLIKLSILAQEELINSVSSQEEISPKLLAESAALGTKIKELTKQHRLVIDQDKNEAFLSKDYTEEDFVICDKCLLSLLRQSLFSKWEDPNTKKDLTEYEDVTCKESNNSKRIQNIHSIENILEKMNVFKLCEYLKIENIHSIEQFKNKISKMSYKKQMLVIDDLLDNY
jgi:hypothetical protein